MYRDRYKSDPKPKNPNRGLAQNQKALAAGKEDRMKTDKQPVPKKNPKPRNPNEGLAQKPKAAAPKPKPKPAAPAKKAAPAKAAPPKPKSKPTAAPAPKAEAPKKMTNYQRQRKMVADRDVAGPRRKK